MKLWFFFNIVFSFNSRTRKGCDTITHRKAIEAIVSIHAPARGAILLRIR